MQQRVNGEAYERERDTQMLVDEGGNADPFVARQLPTEVHGIRDFAYVVKDDLDQNFHPAKDRVITEYRRGVGFGSHSGSQDMKVTARKYYNCMVAASENLDAYVAAAEILIAAATKVADAFRSAEELSLARTQDIDAALRGAVADAEAAKQAAADERQRLINEQRLKRLEREGVL